MGQGDLKDYGRDPAKREVRRRFLTFIEDSFSARTFGWARVLSLAGSDLWEVNEVFSHLPGLKPKNLTIVERNRLNARLIKASLPEAEVYAGELRDYVQATDRKFDIISLDFCSEFCPDVADILGTIRRRELLADRGVILLAVAGHREKEGAKNLLENTVSLALLHQTPEQSARTAMLGHKVPAELVERNMWVRKNAVTHHLICTLIGGQEVVYIQWVVEQGNKELLRRIVQFAFRKYVEFIVMGNGEHFRDIGIPMEQVQGEYAEALGLKIELPGRLTNVEIENTLKVIRDGKMTVEDMERSTIEVEEGVWKVSRNSFNNFCARFWCSLGMDGEIKGPEEAVKRIRFISWNLFKYALIALFQKDLDEWKYKGRGFRLELPDKIGPIIFEYVMGGRARCYWPTRTERYRYRSDSKTPMLVDMIRVDRAFDFNKVVEVSPEGKIVPYIPQKALQSKNPRRVHRLMEETLSDLKRFIKELTENIPVVGNAEYPERVEVVGDEAMPKCENCERLEKELELLKAQLREMKGIIQERRARKIQKRVLGIGPYERRRIAEMLRDGSPEESIEAELKATIRQIAAVKAWVTIKGGYEEYFKWLDEKGAA